MFYAFTCKTCLKQPLNLDRLVFLKSQAYRLFLASLTSESSKQKKNEHRKTVLIDTHKKIKYLDISYREVSLSIQIKQVLMVGK